MVPFPADDLGRWRGLHPQLSFSYRRKNIKSIRAMAKRIATIAYAGNKSPDRELIRQQDRRSRTMSRSLESRQRRTQSLPVAAFAKNLCWTT